MASPRVALVGVLAAACAHAPPAHPAARTPGGDFVAGLPHCAADPAALAVGDLRPDALGSRVTVRGTLVLGPWRFCTMKRCRGRDGHEPVCCNDCQISWFLTGAPGGDAAVALVPPGGTYEMTIGVQDCAVQETVRSAPRPEVLAAGLFQAGELHRVIKYDRLCVVRDAADASPGRQ